jgi:hypothetical protein
MPSTKQPDTITPEAFLGSYSPEVQTIASALRELVKITVPEVQERVALGWQLIGYRVPDGSRSRYFCFVAPLAHEVRLGFEYGVLLSDQGQLEGDGNQVRYVSICSLDEIDPERLSSLIAEAALVALARGVR